MPVDIRPLYRLRKYQTDVNNEHIRLEMEYDILEGDWTDAGMFESLLVANQMLNQCRNGLEM